MNNTILQKLPKDEPIKNNTFWNSCPLRAAYFPESPCSHGKLAIDSKNPEEGCPWGINSPQDNYCFWKWVRRVSDSDGFMEALLQHEITELTGNSSTKIHAIYKDALTKLRDIPEFEALEEAFEDEE